MDRQSFMQRKFLTAAFAGHLQATLKKLNVPATEIQEVMTIAARTHDDVLNL